MREWSFFNNREREIFSLTSAFFSGRMKEVASLEWAIKLGRKNIPEQAALISLLNGREGAALNEPWSQAWQLIKES